MMPPAQKNPQNPASFSAHGMRFGPVALADRTGEGKAVDIYLDRGNGNSISTTTKPETLADWIEDGIFKGTDEKASDLDFPPPETWPAVYAVIFAVGVLVGTLGTKFF
jgi:hypothetical protein